MRTLKYKTGVVSVLWQATQNGIYPVLPGSWILVQGLFFLPTLLAPAFLPRVPLPPLPLA